MYVQPGNRDDNLQPTSGKSGTGLRADTYSSLLLAVTIRLFTELVCTLTHIILRLAPASEGGVINLTWYILFWNFCCTPVQSSLKKGDHPVAFKIFIYGNYYPTHFRAFWNIFIHAPFSCHP
jgi:hypothetical protein